jgi:hypothetical protein
VIRLLAEADESALSGPPDLPRWARLIAELLDTGFLYLTEFHPFSFVLDD